MFKLNLIKNDDKTHIYVFIGEYYNGKSFKEVNELYTSNPDNAFFENIFNVDERTNIKK